MCLSSSEKTISFGTLRLNIAPTVYEPAEDSFLLATYASSLAGAGGILEIGCGSGIVALCAALASPKNKVLGVDINPAAVECAANNAKLNNIANARFELSNMFASVPALKYSAILFNPPYLPTTREERLSSSEENAAYDGGKSGLAVFERFIAVAPNFLAPKGKVAVIATSLKDGIAETTKLLEARIGKTELLAQESFFFEKIALLEAVFSCCKS